MKLLKTQTENETTIERRHHVKRYSLTLYKNLCVGCGICKIICPREAIEIKTISKSNCGEKTQPPILDISEVKCSYCGICDAACPFGALEVKIDGEHIIPVIRTESFPQLIREFEVDTTKCEVGCSECEEVCPLKLIKVRKLSSLQRAREIIISRKNKDAKLKPIIEVEKDSCAGCRLCEMKCPQEAIHVRKIFYGIIKIKREKCPTGCQNCLDVCPIPGALYLSEDGKVHTNESYCVYCGACKVVCPVEGALEFHRVFIRHTPVRSGAWNKAFEKLTSTRGLVKELSTKSLTKARESVERRLLSKGSRSDNG